MGSGQFSPRASSSLANCMEALRFGNQCGL
jgi:hypothetical protein